MLPQPRRYNKKARRRRISARGHRRERLTGGTPLFERERVNNVRVWHWPEVEPVLKPGNTDGAAVAASFKTFLRVPLAAGPSQVALLMFQPPSSPKSVGANFRLGYSNT